MADLLGILTGHHQFAAGDPLDNRYYGPNYGGWGSATKSGEKVTESTAMGYSAAYAATVLLAGTTASLPLNIMRRRGDNREVAEDHPAQSLLKDEPNQHSTATAWMVRGVSEQINWNGGFFCEIERNRLGDPVGLWPIHPSRVEYEVNDQNRLVYTVNSDSGIAVEYPKEKIFHVPGRFIPDGIGSLGVVTNARESIGLGMATERHGAATFGNGCRPTVAVKLNETKLTPDARNNFRNEWMEMHSGAANAGKPPILDGRMELQTFSWSAEDSQFLQTRQHNIEEVARWYGVPPHMIGHLLRSTYSNIEFQGIEFVKYSLMPWLTLWEAEIRRKLITPEQRSQGYYAKFNVNGLMRGDAKSRSEFYRTLIETGVMSPNESRELEDMNPYEGGDIYLVPMNLTTPEEAAKPEPEPQPAPQGNQQQDNLPANEDGALRQDLPYCESSDSGEVVRTALFACLRYVTEIEAHAAISAAADTGRFPTWLHGFYGGHFNTCKEALAPVLAAAGIENADAFIKRRNKAHREQLDGCMDVTTDKFAETVSSIVNGWRDNIKSEAEAIYESGKR